MKIVDVEDATFLPVCPHCEEPLESITRVKDQKGWFQGHLGFCYCCPKCRKVLGFADYAT